MVATDSALRITIRIDIPDSAYPSTCIDLAVPRNSSIAEILDEVLTLADAPRISRPWQATTAAGVLIDAAQPLAHTPLTHGSTIVYHHTATWNHPSCATQQNPSSTTVRPVSTPG